MSAVDYTTKLGALQLKEEIESQLRILSGARQKAFSGLYNRLGATKAKRKKQIHVGSLELSKQNDSKGKVNQEKMEAKGVFIDLCSYDVEVCFDYDEMHNAEADIIGPTTTRMREASDKVHDQAFLDALYGPILMGDPCKITQFRDLCHIPHGGVGITPDKVSEAIDAVSTWFPNSNVCIGVTQRSLTDMKKFDEWTNLDYRVGPSAYAGMVTNWGHAKFKFIPDFRNMGNLEADPFGTIEPIIPATPCIEGGVWDGETFIRFLPVWVEKGIDMVPGYGPIITPLPDVWKLRALAYGVYFIRIDERHGFAMNDERARAVICVKEKSKALAEAYVKQGGVGFGAPDGIDALAA